MNIPLKSGRIHFLSGAHETFSRTDHILGLKSNLTKFKKMEIISSIFSDHRIMRIEINYREKNPNYEKHKNTWRINNMLLNNPEITKEIKNTQRTSPVAQWLRTCLPVQGTWVWSQVWEDSTCCRATKPGRPTPELTGRKHGAPASQLLKSTV